MSEATDDRGKVFPLPSRRRRERRPQLAVVVDSEAWAAFLEAERALEAAARRERGEDP